MPAAAALQWDLFCRVVDNHGDAGVCWRLACELARRGDAVRLVIDDAAALAWMAPEGFSGVEVCAWPGPAEPGDVVIEAFGCDPPAAFVQRMARRTAAPVWINLEYLSAEAASERNHGLPSPQLGGPGKGLDKWFYYPGFVAGTGGLIRETGLAARQRLFDPTAWLRKRGLEPRDAEQRVSLFCYDNQAVPALLDTLARTPTLLLATAGRAARQVLRELGPTLARGALRAVVLPSLTQQDYDALLWACDLNFVRGEDSFVRAQWAGGPFVWQIYPQRDGAHEPKLNAFLGRFLDRADASLAHDVRGLWRAWNSLPGQPIGVIELRLWRKHCAVWRSALLAQPDLVRQLLSFVAERR